MLTPAVFTVLMLIPMYICVCVCGDLKRLFKGGFLMLKSLYSDSR